MTGEGFTETGEREEGRGAGGLVVVIFVSKEEGGRGAKAKGGCDWRCGGREDWEVSSSVVGESWYRFFWNGRWPIAAVAQCSGVKKEDFLVELVEEEVGRRSEGGAGVTLAAGGVGRGGLSCPIVSGIGRLSSGIGRGSTGGGKSSSLASSFTGAEGSGFGGLIGRFIEALWCTAVPMLWNRTWWRGASKRDNEEENSKGASKEGVSTEDGRTFYPPTAQGQLSLSRCCWSSRPAAGPILVKMRWTKERFMEMMENKTYLKWGDLLNKDLFNASVRLVFKRIGPEEAKALAEALKVNQTVTNVKYVIERAILLPPWPSSNSLLSVWKTIISALRVPKPWPKLSKWM
jgi:hypothetical protein